jgi:hypothetical protein
MVCAVLLVNKFYNWLGRVWAFSVTSIAWASGVLNQGCSCWDVATACYPVFINYPSLRGSDILVCTVRRFLS